MRGLRIPWDDLGYVVLGRLTPPRSMCTGGMHASSAVLELVLAKTTACTCGRARKLHSTPRTCSVPRTKFTRTPVVLCPLREGLSPSEGFLPHAARSTQMGGHSSHTIPGRIIRASARPPSTTFVSAAGRTLAPTPIDRAQLRACFLTPPLSTLHRDAAPRPKIVLKTATWTAFQLGGTAGPTLTRARSSPTFLYGREALARPAGGAGPHLSATYDTIRVLAQSTFTTTRILPILDSLAVKPCGRTGH